jgi:hypothetical protein
VLFWYFLICEQKPTYSQGCGQQRHEGQAARKQNGRNPSFQAAKPLLSPLPRHHKGAEQQANNSRPRRAQHSTA